jgi:hypothetical protein
MVRQTTLDSHEIHVCNYMTLAGLPNARKTIQRVIKGSQRVIIGLLKQ